MLDLNVSHAHTVDEVVARMEGIDAALPDADGLKWFNRLYLLVTRNVKAHLEVPEEWRDRDWMAAMVPVFANLYFDAVDTWQRRADTCPRAWQPLFEARRDPALARVQFALAGMNAHINRDLPFAIRTNCRNRDTRPDDRHPRHADYLFVDEILDASEKRALHDPSVSLVADLPFGLPTLTDVLAMWSVRKARAAAWVNAHLLWDLPAPLGELQMGVVDAYSGGFSRGLLTHLRFAEDVSPFLGSSERDAEPVSRTCPSQRSPSSSLEQLERGLGDRRARRQPEAVHR